METKTITGTLYGDQDNNGYFIWRPRQQWVLYMETKTISHLLLIRVRNFSDKSCKEK
jgi:hypothetical protein